MAMENASGRTVPAPGHLSVSGRKARSQIRDALIVTAAVAVITFFHYAPLQLSFISHDTFHVLLRRLYYFPIIYAALRFGIRGGLLTSVVVTILFAPHVTESMGGFFGGSIDNFFEIIFYNVVAFTTGAVVDAKHRQSLRYQEVLELNREIEDREAAIRAMKAYTESILNSVSSGVISCDQRGRVATANPEAARLLGFSPGEMAMAPLSRVFATHTELLRAAELVLSGEQQRATLETDLAPVSGAPLPVAVRITPHLSGSRLLGIVITIEDLSEVIDLTEQLLRADRLANLGELVAGVAHEVRNPLGVIKASVQMMQQEPAGYAAGTELARVVVQEIDRLDALVNTLLDFGRPSHSQLGPVSAGRALDEVILITKQFARQQRVSVRRDFDESLPPVWADEDRLKQVFVNLISNAVQAMPGGGSITIGAAAHDGFLQLSFTDTGTGIAGTEKDRIFDPFHTSRADGSGLGLSIVHRIVDAHNGYITVDSEPGGGSAFTVGLPLAAPDSNGKQTQGVN